MSGGQIAALVLAILLLLPGGCFVLAGLVALTDRNFAEDGLLALLIAAAILGLAGYLFRIAFRRRQTRRETPGGPQP